MNSIDLIEQLFTSGHSAIAIDQLIQESMPLSGFENQPFIPLEVKTKKSLAHMMMGSPRPHIYIENDSFYFGGIYKATAIVPKARVYHLRKQCLSSVGKLVQLLTTNLKVGLTYYHTGNYKELLNEFNTKEPDQTTSKQSYTPSMANTFIEYFRLTYDPDTVAVCVDKRSTSSYFSKIIESSKEKLHPISITDQFSGKIPTIINNRFVTTGHLPIQIAHTVSLDSNLVSNIHLYMTRDERLPAKLHKPITELLHIFSKTQCDFNAMFYAVESCCKSSIDNWMTHAPAHLATIIRLQCMSEKDFLNSQKINLKPEAVNHYLSLHGGSNLEECGVKYAKKLLSQIPQLKFHDEIAPTYICLLKIACLHLQSGKGPVNKYRAFTSFMKEEFGAWLAREAVVAIYHFCDLTGKFIGIQKGTSIEKAKANLSASSWDISLLRIAERELVSGLPEQLMLCHIATLDDKLGFFGSVFNIENIILNPSINNTHRISFNYTDIEKKIGESGVKKIQVLNSNIAKQRLHTKPRSMTEQKICHLIIELETELTTYCK